MGSTKRKWRTPEELISIDDVIMEDTNPTCLPHANRFLIEINPKNLVVSKSSFEDSVWEKHLRLSAATWLLDNHPFDETKSIDTLHLIGGFHHDIASGTWENSLCQSEIGSSTHSLVVSFSKETTTNVKILRFLYFFIFE